MPAISFTTLKDKILDGSKKQTIRPYGTGWWIERKKGGKIVKRKKGDRLVGYWMMRTKQCEKLFESVFSENPFIVILDEIKTSDKLMRRDGFDSANQAWEQWFKPHYGNSINKFVVLRWH